MTERDRSLPRRQVRSFVLRGGRLTPGQERAFATLWPRWGIDNAVAGPLDLGALFGNTNPVYLEIGFGNGESLVAMARAHPERNYLGVEVHPPGIGHLLLRLDANGCENIRVIRDDALDVMDRVLAPRCLAGIYLFFPDPWHKKRHHKRRIVQPTFLDRVHRVLRRGGFLHAATDWEDYAGQMLQTLRADGRFENLAADGGFLPRPADRPLTRFEQRGQRLGHGVHDLVFRVRQ
jgi:tRNA (guanine-N7-)-methyltransferase